MSKRIDTRRYRKLGILLFIVVLITAIIGYISMPALSLSNAGMWCLLLLFFSVGSFYLFLESDIGLLLETPIHHVFYFVMVIIAVAMLLMEIFSFQMFRSNKYKALAEVEEGNFQEDFLDVAQDQSFVFLDLDTARRVGDRVLGNVPNATWYEVSPAYNLIVYNGKQYRISPLRYGENLKYLKARDYGIPGYVLVDVETQEAEFVQTESPIRYSPSACFRYNLKRHIRTKYPSAIIDDYQFEIDEEGTPYWIVGIMHANAGVWGAYTVDSFVLVNACTGEMKLYKLEDKPAWIDHVQSLKRLMKVIYWKYEYVNGFFNFSDTGVLRTTYSYKNDSKNFYGYNQYVDKNGEVVIFTGVTPKNQTESNIGFLTINASTGKYTYYPLSGAEESSAQEVAEGLIQNMGYQSNYPFMININGEPVYLMSMKDKAGLIQRYALVNYKNYGQACVAITFEEALEGYLKLIGVEVEEETTQETEIVEEIEPVVEINYMHDRGYIADKFEAIIDGNTHYYYFVNGSIYHAPFAINMEQGFFKIGREVVITYYETPDSDILEATEIYLSD